MAKSSFKTFSGHVARAHLAEERCRNKFLQAVHVTPNTQLEAESSVAATVGRFHKLSSQARENLNFVLRHHPLQNKLLSILSRLNPNEFSGLSGEKTLRALCCRENERAAEVFTNALLSNLESYPRDSVSAERFMKVVRSLRRRYLGIVPPYFLRDFFQ